MRCQHEQNERGVQTCSAQHWQAVSDLGLGMVWTGLA